MKKSIRKMFLSILITFLATAGVSITDGLVAFAIACDYYASPNGGGSGSSPSSPFKVSQFWSVARPGSTLCLLDGVYTGAASMIRPPQNLRGTTNARITIKALNDGKVSFNGQSANAPVKLYRNDYFVLEGFNAHNSSGDVIELSRSNNNIVRRIAAWDAADGNTNIFAVHEGNNNLLEDIAGWGIARKIFSSSQGGNFTTIRRAWGRWEGSHNLGPKLTYTLAYNSYDFTCENCIGTWSGEKMRATYTLHEGSPGNVRLSTGAVSVPMTDFRVDQPNSIFGTDGFKNGRDNNARAKLLGSIAYIQAKDSFPANQAILLQQMQSVELTNVVVYIEPGSYTSKKALHLGTVKTGSARHLIARNITSIGGGKSYFHSEWQGNNRAHGPNPGSIPNVFGVAGNGARICHRYKDGVLTNEPLWPWPMNRRIVEATVLSGRTPVDVTSIIEKKFGPIPDDCRGPSNDTGSTSYTTTPPAPVNLLVTP